MQPKRDRTKAVAREREKRDSKMNEKPGTIAIVVGNPHALCKRADVQIGNVIFRCPTEEYDNPGDLVTTVLVTTLAAFGSAISDLQLVAAEVCPLQPGLSLLARTEELQAAIDRVHAVVQAVPEALGANVGVADPLGSIQGRGGAPR